MSATFQKEAGQIWQLRISGVLKKAELDLAQATAGQEIAQAGKIKVLLMLDGFQGWEKGADWGDITFTAAYGDQIEKMAIVGDRRWETEALMFVGAGIRRTPVKFFVLGAAAQARAWLAEALT
jgi:hypothetical protein